MDVQEFEGQGQKDSLRMAISNETVQGDSSDNHGVDAASVIPVESLAATMEVGTLDHVGDDVPDKSQKDCSESDNHSGEVKESQPCNLQEDPYESHEVDINFGDEQHVESSDGLGGNASISNEKVEGDSNDNHGVGAASVIQVESQAAVMEVDALDHVGDEVPDKSQKDFSESNDHSGEVKESQPCNLQADPYESHEVDINSGDVQSVESSEGLGGNAECASQPTEIQKVILEDKSVATSDARTVSDESGSHKDNAGENVIEDTKAVLVPEPKEIQDATEVEPGICRAEDSGKESVCGPILKENENNSSVLSVNDDSISEGKEGYQHIDDSEKPFELHSSISIEKPETKHAGEETSEEATSKLLPEPDKNQDAITVENGHFEVAHVLGSEESGTQSVGETSVEIQESYQHVDSSEKPFDLHPSSGISEAQIPAFQVPKPEADLGGENITEDTRMKLLPESDENDGSIAEICENGHLEDDHGLSAEEPGTGSVSGPSCKVNEDHCPVVSVDHSVSERNESSQRIDDSETSLEMHSSSSISSTPVVASSCLKPDTDLGEGPDPDIDDFQGHEVDQEASSCKEVVEEVKNIENLKPENEDVDAFAVESVENAHHITKDKILETESIAPDTSITVADQAAQIPITVADQAAQIPITVADQAAQIEDSADQAAQVEDSADQVAQIENSADHVAQIEDSAGGNTKVYSPGKTASSESKTATSIKVGDVSCCEAHSIEDLHDTEPVTGISYSERETATSHGDDLDFKNEIVLASAESNNVSPVVSNAESDLKEEKSSSTGSRNMSSSDDSEILIEVHPSSSISDVPIVVSNCMKPEIDLGERPGQNIENAPVIDVFQGHEVDQEASSSKEFVEVQSVEDSRPENEDIDALAVESVENGHSITKDTNLEIQSCVPDTTITVIDQAAKIEDSSGGDTILSSSGANFEKKTATSVEGDEFSCSDGHSPIEHIHGIEPVLGITDPDGEMATFHGECLDSKNEIVPGNAKSNDITTAILNAESEFKQENLSSDDNEKSLEMHLSSSNSNAPFVVSSFVKPEIELGGERLGQSIENASDFDVSQRQDVVQEASSCEENGVVQLLEDLRPESEDTDAKGVGSIENGHHNTEDNRLEIKSSVPDTNITVTDQFAENENAAGGDSDFPFPGKNARSENKAATTKVNDLSFSDESVLNIANPVREMTALNGTGLDSKNEIVPVSVKSNDIPTVVSDAKSDFAPESSSGIGSRKVSSSDLFLSEGGGPVSNENAPNLLVGTGDSENKEEKLTSEDVNRSEKLTFQERDDVEKSIVTSAEISGADARNGQGMGSESLMKPFPYLIRMPKFDDTEIREQVRQAQLIVEEKTRLRDAFRHEIVKYRNNCREHDSRFKAAMDEARSSKRAVKSKRAEIDSLQTVINKVKNAQSIDDIDARIVSLEHMIEHETRTLLEEKQFIREIKQLKQLREQLSSSIGSKDEVQQALKDKDQIEGRLKGLRKELDGLKDSVLKAEAVAQAVDKIYEAESKKLKEAQDQYTAADNVRQEAYKHMQNLRTEMYEKNQRFRMFKRDASAAYDHAAKRETDALHTLCFKQVESVMELWKNDAEFRKEYVLSSMRSTLKRLGTSDGRSLGPDEKPQFFSNPVHGGVDRPGNPSYELPTEILKQEGQEKHIVEVVALSDEDSNKVKEEEEALKSLKAKKTTNQGKIHSGNGLDEAAVSGSGIITNDVREVERLPTKEELELARKAEELRKEELKEQRRQEEKAKALEALERKKKIAEKAQSRAELRAQKEAEQREKEREKRLRKKERKKATGAEAAPDADNSGDTIVAKSEGVIESAKEAEIKETSASATVGKKAQKPVQPMKQSKTKSIPPPLRNRGRKKLQQWIWGIVTCLVIVLVFFVINVGFFTNLSVNLKRPTNV